MTELNKLIEEALMEYASSVANPELKRRSITRYFPAAKDSDRCFY